MDNSCKTPKWQQLKAQLNNLHPKQFLELLQNLSNPIVIDVRTAQEFSTGHIANALNIDYLADDFWEQIEKLSTENDFLIYCRTGRRSIRTCTLMRNGGFDNKRIFNLEGGYERWMVDGFPQATVSNP